ncbi:MAG: 6-phosphogluconolactonase [Patescibacteria group bacterium]|nr:6-phosphogluconolactonase [Patescibacteria group bacterium]
METIRTNGPAEGARRLASDLAARLSGGRPVLWLVCGGSNIKAAAEALDAVRRAAPPEALGRLAVGLTDERYGPVGHPDSNWKQLADAGFGFEGVRRLPVLSGKSLSETVAAYAETLDAECRGVRAAKGSVVALFGIGADGHIAGILPHSPAASERGIVAGYDAGAYTRVTIAPSFFPKIDAAYAFVFGEGKRAAVARLTSREAVAPIDQPAQLIKTARKAYLFTDMA